MTAITDHVIPLPPKHRCNNVPWFSMVISKAKITMKLVQYLHKIFVSDNKTWAS